MLVTDFVIFNPYHNLFMYVALYFEFSISGNIITSSKISTVRRTYYSSPLDIVRMISEIIYILLFFFYFVIEVMEIANKIKEERKIFEKKQL